MTPILLAIALVLVLGGLSAWYYLLYRPLPVTQGTFRLPGLQGPVEIIRDRWGVPHIYAQSNEDLFFAQGFVHAQDRLWQMDLMRRMGSGRLAEIFGEVALEFDRFIRTIGLNRAAEAEAASVDPETRALYEAYAAGVNAFLNQPNVTLPLEFTLLGYRPEPWRAEDSMYWAKMMTWNLTGNWESELVRLRLVRALGAERAASLEPPYPDYNPSIVSGPGIPSGQEPPPPPWGSPALLQAMRELEAHLRELGLAENRAPGESRTRRSDGEESRREPDTPTTGVAHRGGGSNQWVISGERSTTGRPLLANDTHLMLQLPNVWYECHLQGGDYNVTGVSLPGLPGIIIGHNEHIAWGMTTAWQDVQDLYIEKFNPDNPHQYEFQGQWEEAQVIREEIRVKGQDEPVIEEVLVTCHGPIISKVLGEEVPLALRWVGEEPGQLARSHLAYNKARNWEEFTAALRYWTAPGHNFIYADVEGNIGYLQAGRVPVRAKGYGLVPVPGWTGEYEWVGEVPFEELPQAVNPPTGWLATANNRPMDDTYPYHIGADWENPCRARRVVDLLTEKEQLSPQDCTAMQMDVLDIPCRDLIRYLVKDRPARSIAETDEERRALSFLRAWDGRLTTDSVGATIAEALVLFLVREVLSPHLGDLTDMVLGMGITPLGGISPHADRNMVFLLDLLRDADSPWWVDPATGQRREPDTVVRQALCRAIDALRSELGQDMAQWRWGRLHRAVFGHPLGQKKPLHLLFNKGPFPMPGGLDTLQRAIFEPRFPPPPVHTVAAWRQVIVLGDWERSLVVYPGGQSGHPSSPHYADLIPLWLKGAYHPMLWERTSVEQHMETRLILEPMAP